MQYIVARKKAHTMSVKQQQMEFQEVPRNLTASVRNSSQQQLLSQNDQQTIRTEYEQQYGDRAAQLKQFYEMRLLGLQESIRECLQKIYSDDLVSTMKKDPISNEFLGQRVKEIFEEVISADREQVIDKLSQQLIHMRQEFAQ